MTLLVRAFLDAIVNNQDITDNVDQFLAFIAESRTALVPAEEMNFAPSYFVDLFETSESTVATDDIVDVINLESDETLEGELDTEDIFDDEDLCKPVLTTDIADRPFDLNDTFDISAFIDFNDENPLR